MGRRSKRAGSGAGEMPDAAPRASSALSAGRTWACLVLAVACALSALAYSNTFQNNFVYDDVKQILSNPLVQERHLFWTAMTSDVWAFTGEQGKNWSNYWRPLWIAWVSLNYAFFGTNPVGWHVANLMLHLLATALGYFVLRQLGAEPAACAIATWLFASHPAHVESVTWISGSADPMLASFLLGAFLCHRAGGRRNRAVPGIGAVLLFAAALLTKEIAIVFPALLFCAELVATGGWRRDELRSRIQAALVRTLPYVLVSAVYAVVRVGVVRMKILRPPGGPGLDGVFLSAPAVLLFYLRHVFFPISLGPSYPLRVVTLATVSLTNWLLPFLLALLVGYGTWMLWRKNGIYRVEILWFLLPLAPVFDVRSFLPEDFVHDRYLYLPTFGALAFAATALVEARKRGTPSARQDDDRKLVWRIGLPVAVLLAVLARSYNPTWSSEIALWERGVATNPGTAFPHVQLGDAYRKVGHLGEARRELERALELNPEITAAHVSIAALDIREGRLDDAVSRLTNVLSQYPSHRVAIEQLGLAYQKLGKLEEAIALFERGRQAVPYRWANYTVNLAVLHGLSNDMERARKELESLGPALRTTKDPDVLRAWSYLGDIYRSRGERAAAITAYETYLAVTDSLDAPEVRALRKVVAETLERMKAES